jgi:hypothetical protein
LYDGSDDRAKGFDGITTQKLMSVISSTLNVSRADQVRHADTSRRRCLQMALRYILQCPRDLGRERGIAEVEGQSPNVERGAPAESAREI